MLYIVNTAITLLFFINLTGKILLITYTAENPDLLEVQDKSLKKFLTEDYDFVVFNYSKDNKIKQEISDRCAKLHLQCILVPDNRDVIEYLLNTMAVRHNEIVILIDPNIFL